MKTVSEIYIFLYGSIYLYISEMNKTFTIYSYSSEHTIGAVLKQKIVL